ncbi:MAG: hypothetical protein US54_C0067G0001, partial [Candidatus Roizmanbacteria bacterium GW2011_GWA2_37_7]
MNNWKKFFTQPPTKYILWFLIIVSMYCLFLSIYLLRTQTPRLLIKADSQPAAQADGKVYYVSTTGSNNNPGTMAAPWKTIQYGVDQLAAGDTLLVRGGFYDECRIEPRNHGEEGKWITVKNYPGETPVLDKQRAYCKNDFGDVACNTQKGCFGFFHGVPGSPSSQTDKGSYYEISGFKIRNFWFSAIACWNTHHVKVTNNIVEYAGSSAIAGLRHGCNNMIIENNIVRYTGQTQNGIPGRGWGSGISLNYQSNPFPWENNGRFHNIIRNNIVYGSYDPGEYAEHSEGSGIVTDLGEAIPPTLIENNLIFNNGRNCLYTYQNHNVWIVGNTCFKNCQDTTYGNCSQDWVAELYLATNQPANVVILDNIIYADKAYGLTGVHNNDISGYNLFFGGRGQTGSIGRNSITGHDPKFSNININCGPQTYSNPQGICASDNPQDFRAYFGLKADGPATDKIAETAASYSGPGGSTQHLAQSDINGLNRPAGAGYDIGAFEYSSNTALPSITPSPTVPVPTLGPANALPQFNRTYY